LPLSYYDLLEKPDWYQSFDGNANVITQLPYTLKTGGSRLTRQFVNDAPPGVGGSSMQLQLGQIECEFITDANTLAYPRQSGQTSHGATYEFWIKIPSGYTLSQGNYKLLFRERTASGTTIYDRIRLTPDWRIEVAGLNNGGNGNGYYMSSGNIATEPLAFDTWHHISIVYAEDTIYQSSTSLRGYAGVFIYLNGILAAIKEGDEISGANQSSTTGTVTSSNFNGFGWDLSVGANFSGETTNDGGFFAQYNGTGIPIKIAGFAQWMNTAQTNKQIARRYMKGIGASKTRQKALIESSAPWFACDLNNVSWDGTNESFQTQFGSNVTSNGNWTTVLSTGLSNNITLKNPDSLEGNGISQTTTWTNQYSGQIIFEGTKSAQLDTIHNSGNMSLECWVKWGHTKNSFKSSKAGVGPVMTIFNTTGACHNIRSTADGRIEFIDRYNDVPLGYYANTGPWSQQLLTKNDWVHLAATYQNVGGTVTARYYVNGRQINTRTITGTLSNPLAGAVNALILLFAGTAASAEPKTMDIFAIYDRGLSTAEVKNRYLNYAALDKDVKYYDGTNWQIPTANKVWDGSQWAFWDSKKYDGTSWVNF
jgi:hypothetical protein